MRVLFSGVTHLKIYRLIDKIIMLIDIHAKSSHSDDVTLSVEDVLKQAKEAGLHGVAFTEALSSSNCQAAIDAGKAHGIAVFIGVEIPTDKGIVLGYLPEIDSYYLNEEWRELTEYTTPAIEDVIAEFNERGGAVIAARPYDLNIPFNMGDMLFRIDDLAGVEVFNPNCGELQNDFALEAARFLGLPTAGGSDPRDGAKGMGKFATLFLEDLETQSDFVEALRARAFWAIQIGEHKLVNSSLTSDPFAQKKGGSGRDDRGGRGGRGGRDRGGRGGDRGDRGGRGGRDNRERGGGGGGDRRRGRGGSSDRRGRGRGRSRSDNN